MGLSPAELLKASNVRVHYKAIKKEGLSSMATTVNKAVLCS